MIWCMSKPPIDELRKEAIYFPYGRKSHKGEKNDQRHTEREQRESALRFVQERISREGQGELAPDPWAFDDKSGTTDQRDAYQRRLAEVRAARKAGRPAYLVVGLLDRLGRDAEELHRCKKELDKLGARLLAVDFAGEIADEVFPYVVATAQVGSVKISNNVRRINAQVRRDGWWRPSGVPWGYKIVPSTPEQQGAGAPKVTLAIDEPQAKRVREAFAAVAAGQAVTRIARWVATLPAAERGGHQTRDGWKARALGQQVLKVVLRSPIYVAEQPDGTPGRWPALIARETWEAAQAALDGAKTAPPKQASGDYLLTGLLWCPLCAERGTACRMRGADKRSYGRARRYACSAVAAGARVPIKCHYSVRADDADRDVLRQVQPLLVVDTDREYGAVAREVGRLLREGQGGPPDDVQSRLAAVQATIDTAKSARRVLMQKLAAELIGDDEFREEVAPYRAAIAEGEAARDALAKQAGMVPLPGFGAPLRLTVADVMRQWAAWQAQWLATADDVAHQRPYLAEVIARIEPVRDAKGDVHCAITWTEEGQLLAAVAHLAFTPGE